MHFHVCVCVCVSVCVSVCCCCRMSTMTTGIYVLSIAVCHCTLPPCPVAPCCQPSPPRSSTSRRLPAHRRRLSTNPPPPRRRRQRRRSWRRGAPERPSAAWLTRALPPYIIASIIPSVAPCARPTGPGLVSTADRRLALWPLHRIPHRDAVDIRKARNSQISRRLCRWRAIYTGVRARRYNYRG